MPSAPKVRAPRGTTRVCKGWQQEAAWRMIQHNLDPEVAEKPEELIVYGGAGKAARDWDSFHRILATLRELQNACYADIIRGARPLGDFEQFVRQWHALGGATMTREANDLKADMKWVYRQVGFEPPPPAGT